jgi:hypothetical protein
MDDGDVLACIDSLTDALCGMSAADAVRLDLDHAVGELVALRHRIERSLIQHDGPVTGC